MKKIDYNRLHSDRYRTAIKFDSVHFLIIPVHFVENGKHTELYFGTDKNAGVSGVRVGRRLLGLESRLDAIRMPVTAITACIPKAN